MMNSLPFRLIGRSAKGSILLACVLITSVIINSPANAMKIKEVISPGGIRAWLVEEHAIPVVSMRFAFRGGASQDPKGREGLAYFVSGMLDEGAGDLTSTQFQEQVEEVAVKINFDASRDFFTGSFRSLSGRLNKGVDLLRLSMTKPRFDQDAIERIRGQITTGLKFDLNDPNKIAAREWYKLAFPGHQYSRAIKGNDKTLATIKKMDLQEYVSKIFARDNLTIAVVGDITEAQLSQMLDRAFGDLPAKAKLSEIPEASPPTGPKTKIIEMKVPQSVAQFGLNGIKRKDKDFTAAFVLNYIIGGGGFSSKLMEEVREKRGLAYSVYSYLSPYQKGSAYIGGVATKNESIGQSLQVIRQVFAQMAKEGPSAEDLESAKKYLTGSYALRFDTSSKIASQLMWIQIEDLGMDYIEKRNSLIEAITLEDVRQVAARLLKADDLIVTIVGKPSDLAKVDKNQQG